VPKTFLKWLGSDEFCEKETAEKCAGPPCKPLVNANDWPVVLLDLLFTQGKLCGKDSVELSLETHLDSATPAET
jgi:hypothetical protein